MKLVKMSLAAAMLMGASAFAIENTKISGDAQLFYATSDQGQGVDLFDKDGAYADAGIHLNLTTDLIEGVSAGLSYTALSTLGLENNLVSGVWTSAHSATPVAGAANAGWFQPLGPTVGNVQVDDASWFNEAWLATTVGNTTAKIGRMTLDTPMAFTETWTIAQNTFEGAVILNQDLPDTTLVAAWIGKGNGASGGGVVQPDGTMNTFAVNGAYAYAIVNNSFKPLTAQAWYYDVLNAAHAYWLQGDLNMDGIIAGIQYAGATPTGVLSGGDDSSVYALKLGYETDAFSITGAYSSTSDKGTVDFSNVATGSTTWSQSKLYTEAWWNYGMVSAMDTQSFNITASTMVSDYTLSAFFTNAENGAAGNAGDMTEFTGEVDKSFGPIDTSLVYINSKLNGGDSFSTLQLYLTLNY